VKIIIMDGKALNPGDMSWSDFEEYADVTVYEAVDYNDKAQIIERISDADAILINKVPIDEEILAAVPNLKYIGVSATGYNIVDIDAANRHHVTVTNIPAYATNAVTQFTFALLLEVASQVGVHNASIHAGEWQKAGTFSYWKTPLMEIHGKTMGLVGYGNIAQSVAKVAEAFGLQVIYYNHRPKTPTTATQIQVSLDELYAQADFISLHLPQNADTVNMINAESVAKMKPTAILINTARGGLVEPHAVAEALNAGKLAAYAADVQTEEPIEDGNPFLTSKNTYLTPHIAWAPIETRQRLLQISIDNFAGFVKGESQNVVS
jgi:glycerate dehydrogenase